MTTCKNENEKHNKWEAHKTQAKKQKQPRQHQILKQRTSCKTLFNLSNKVLMLITSCAIARWFDFSNFRESSDSYPAEEAPDPLINGLVKGLLLAIDGRVLTLFIRLSSERGESGTEELGVLFLDLKSRDVLIMLEQWRFTRFYKSLQFFTFTC